ncbi:hypothetical protein BJ912DRAFT_1074223 [Pholiota molesta]|nr:hypothetical protein BJ912DRAFT_1074223 [Pholiota molesta]
MSSASHFACIENCSGIGEAPICILTPALVHHGIRVRSALSTTAPLFGPVPASQIRLGPAQGLHEETALVYSPNEHLARPKERERVKAWMKEIGERVKERMLEIQPRGFKYVVLTQINENRGQGGRADIVCHWEDSDVVAQEMYYNHLPFPDHPTQNTHTCARGNTQFHYPVIESSIFETLTALSSL